MVPPHTEIPEAVEPMIARAAKPVGNNRRLSGSTLSYPAVVGREVRRLANVPAAKAL